MMVARCFLAVLLFAIMQYAPAAPLTRAEVHALFDNFDTSIGAAEGGGIAGFSRKRMFIPNATPEPPVKDNGRPAEHLLKKIKKSPYDYGYDRRGRILAQRGEKVLPALVEELQNAGGYYRICLIHIMGATPAPARDAAFLAHGLDRVKVGRSTDG